MESVKKRKRQSLEKAVCKYGSSCYQKNPKHLDTFSHPSTKKLKKDSTTKVKEDENFIENNPPIQPTCGGTVAQKLKCMPSDFFDFWNFCKSVNCTKPEEAFNDFGLHLVGPYDILSQKLTDKDMPEYHCHWRFYYDPPEFETVIKQDGKDLYHIGYYRDEPSKLPSILASNSAAIGPKLTLMGDNIFSAVNSVLSSLIKKLKNESQKKKLSALQVELQKEAEKKKYSLEMQTPKTKARDKKVVAKTFHGLGIVVPYNAKTDVGYRPLPDSNSKLKSILNAIASAEDEKKRLIKEATLEEIITNVHFANDEGDIGTGLELGIDLFCYGDPCLDSFLKSVLCMAYNLLNRQEYAEILKAHLKNRRKGDNLSILSDEAVILED